jgi:hypothetical protein
VGPVTGRVRAAADLMLSGIVLAGATASGAVLFAIAEGGYAAFLDLLRQVAIPGALAVVLAPLLARLTTGPRLGRAVLAGAAAGLVGMLGLELVREIGFRVFDSMPGDIAMLMGVLATGRIMQGPDLASNLAGWGDHAFNGAMFGITWAVLIGGFPRRARGGAGIAALIGAGYGLLLATGFLISPVPTAVGAGFFGADFGAKFAITVYLAHALFGAITGLVVHRLSRPVAPIWQVAIDLVTGRPPTPSPATEPVGR